MGRQISFSFEERAEDEPFLERVALAYELAAIEGLDELSRPAGLNRELRDQAVAASFRAFDIRRLLPVTELLPSPCSCSRPFILPNQDTRTLDSD